MFAPVNYSKGRYNLQSVEEQAVKASPPRPDKLSAAQQSTAQQVVLFARWTSLLFCISPDLRQLHIESVESVLNR